MIGMTSLNQCWGREGCISSRERAVRNVCPRGIARLPLTRSLPTRLAYKEGTRSHTRWGQWRGEGSGGRGGETKLVYVR